EPDRCAGRPEASDKPLASASGVTRPLASTSDESPCAAYPEPLITASSCTKLFFGSGTGGRCWNPPSLTTTPLVPSPGIGIDFPSYMMSASLCDTCPRKTTVFFDEKARCVFVWTGPVNVPLTRTRPPPGSPLSKKVP